MLTNSGKGVLIFTGILAALAIAVLSSVVVTADPGDYDVNGRLIYLDADGDTSIGASADDTYILSTNSVQRFKFGPVSAVVNENSVDYDLRFEGDGDANLLYLDAGNDRVGIGTNAPATTLDVSGTATIATADINAGNIDATTIGGGTPAAGSFTTVGTNNHITINGDSKSLYFGANQDASFTFDGGDTIMRPDLVTAGDSFRIRTQNMNSDFYMEHYGTSARVHIGSAGGNLGAPTAVTDAFAIGIVNFDGYYVTGGPGWGLGPAIVAVAKETWTSTSHGSELNFYTVDTTTTTQDKRLTIDSAGDFAFNNGDLTGLGNANTEITSTGADFAVPVDIANTLVINSDVEDGAITFTAETATITADNTAHPITAGAVNAHGTYAIINGGKAWASATFMDVVIYSRYTTPTVVASANIYGSPSARTYSIGSGGDENKLMLKIDDSSASYGVTVHAMEVKEHP